MCLPCAGVWVTVNKTGTWDEAYSAGQEVSMTSSIQNWSCACMSGTDRDTYWHALTSGRMCIGQGMVKGIGEVLVGSSVVLRKRHIKTLSEAPDRRPSP